MGTRGPSWSLTGAPESPAAAAAAAPDTVPDTVAQAVSSARALRHVVSVRLWWGLLGVGYKHPVAARNPGAVAVAAAKEEEPPLRHRWCLMVSETPVPQRRQLKGDEEQRHLVLLWVLRRRRALDAANRLPPPRRSWRISHGAHSGDAADVGIPSAGSALGL